MLSLHRLALEKHAYIILEWWETNQFILPFKARNPSVPTILWNRMQANLFDANWKCQVQCLMISYFPRYSLNILCIVANLWPCSWSSLYLLCLGCILVKITCSWCISCPSEEVAHFLMSPTSVVLVYLHLSILHDQLTEEENGSQLGSMMGWLALYVVWS